VGQKTVAQPIDDETIAAAVPFTVRRHVKWGDVDFARVMYTPRFLDWVLEAVETWFRHTLGQHWAEFDAGHGLIMPVVACRLEFARALPPDERVDLAVRVEAIGRSSHTMRVDGMNRAGEACFTGIVTWATADPATAKSVPMPAHLRDRLEAYKAACDAA
jgi:acyl-CoA thioesterase FadM